MLRGWSAGFWQWRDHWQLFPRQRSALKSRFEVLKPRARLEAETSSNPRRPHFCFHARTHAMFTSMSSFSAAYSEHRTILPSQGLQSGHFSEFCRE
jgi:hypothetical protein